MLRLGLRLGLRLREFTTFSGVGGWCGRIKNKAISVFKSVKVEAELGNIDLQIIIG